MYSSNFSQGAVQSIKRRNNARWSQATLDLIERYRGEYSWYGEDFDARLTRKYPNSAYYMKMQKIGFGYVQSVVQELAKIYSNPPERLLYLLTDNTLAPVETQQAFEDLIDSMDLDSKLFEVNEYTELLNGVVVYCLPNFQDVSVDIDWMPMPNVRVVQDPLHPRDIQHCRLICLPIYGGGELDTVAVQVAYIQFYRSADGIVQVRVAEGPNITDRSVKEYAEDQWIAAINGAGWTRYPIVLATAIPSIGTDLFPDLDWQLIGQQEFFDDEFTRGGYVTWHGDMPILIHRGDSTTWGNQNVMGPGTVLHTGDPTSDLSVLTRDAREPIRMQNLREHAQMFSAVKRVPPDTFRPDDAQVSGEARTKQNQRYIEAMRQRQVRWKVIDQDVCAAVLQTASILGDTDYLSFTELYEISTFAPFDVPLTPFDRSQLATVEAAARKARYELDKILVAEGMLTAAAFAAEWGNLTADEVSTGEIGRRIAEAKAAGVSGASGGNGGSASGGGLDIASLLGAVPAPVVAEPVEPGGEE